MKRCSPLLWIASWTVASLLCSMALATGNRLEQIRADLVALEFEKALFAVQALLEDPAIPDEERNEALVLRAQIHGALGDFDAVEQDYREILGADPGWQPDARTTPGKAMERFTKVREKTIGTVKIDLRPADARLTVDGRPVTVPADGSLPLLVGRRVLRAEAGGHDPEELTVDVEAETVTQLQIRLVPNARTVILRTEPPEVTVTVDGEPVGTTRRVARSPSAPGVLVLEDLPLGEHTFELSRRCHSTRRFTDLLSVDLMDLSPKEYETVRLPQARTLLTLTGGPAGGEVRVDGEVLGSLPLDPLTVCPGDVELEVRAGGRTVWFERIELDEDLPETREINARPGAVLLGARSWPRGLAPVAGTVSTLAIRPLPVGFPVDDEAAWSRLSLPADTDLVVAVVPGRGGAAEGWLLYSPLLGTVERLDGERARLERPSWTVSAWGMTLADGRIGGPGRVVGIVDAGPAAAAGIAVGDRVVAVAGRRIEGAPAVRQALAAVPPGTPVTVQLVAVDGQPKDVVLRAKASPRLLYGQDPADTPSGWLAAWAAVDAAADPELRPTALANLALLLSRHGRPERAVEVWGRVRWGERRGIGDGTAAYYLGRELQRLGREEQAVRALRHAADSPHTAVDDEGPAVAPAARDRLIDLGVGID